MVPIFVDTEINPNETSNWISRFDFQQHSVLKQLDYCWLMELSYKSLNIPYLLRFQKKIIICQFFELSNHHNFRIVMLLYCWLKNKKKFFIHVVIVIGTFFLCGIKVVFKLSVTIEVVASIRIGVETILYSKNETQKIIIQNFQTS